MSRHTWNKHHPALPPLSANQRKAMEAFAAHVYGTPTHSGCPRCQHGGVTLDPADGCAEGRRLAACVTTGRDPDELMKEGEQ